MVGEMGIQACHNYKKKKYNVQTSSNQNVRLDSYLLTAKTLEMQYHGLKVCSTKSSIDKNLWPPTRINPLPQKYPFEKQ